jgi:hypothetical protein
MRFSHLRTINTAIINLALVLLIAGLGIVFAVIWGPNIKYTHTYYHLSQSVSAYAKPLAFGDLYFSQFGGVVFSRDGVKHLRYSQLLPQL